MSVPTPVLFVLAVLVGWPLIQIGSVLIARPFRKRLKETVINLRSDQKLTDGDRAHIEGGISIARNARGVAYRIALTPLVLPFYILAEVVRELLGYPDNEPTPSLGGGLIDRPKFGEFLDLCKIVLWVRRPVSAVVAVVLSLPILPIALLAFGVTGIRAEFKKVMNRFAWVAFHA